MHEEDSFPAKDARWYVIETRSRHEKKVAARLRENGIVTFLPLVSQTHQWSDRRKVLRLPLFTRYVFVRLSPSTETRRLVLKTPGVVGFVAINGRDFPITQKQMEGIQALLSNDITFSSPILQGWPQSLFQVLVESS